MKAPRIQSAEKNPNSELYIISRRSGYEDDAQEDIIMPNSTLNS